MAVHYSRDSGLRSRAAPLLRTLPGRAVVVGAGVRFALYLARVARGTLPPFFDVVDAMAGVAIAAGAAYFLYRLFLVAKRRLLWRVRRKLILSYVFIGLVPALLIIAFFLLGALLLFFNVSSYMVQAEVRALDDRARFLATSAALEIQRRGERSAVAVLEREARDAQAALPGAALALVPVGRACAATTGAATDAASSIEGAMRPVAAGPWTHLDPPTTLPAWIACDGVAGLTAFTHQLHEGQDTHMLVRAAAFPDASRPDYAVIVDVPVTGELKARLRQSTGVDMVSVSPVVSSRQNAHPLTAREVAANDTTHATAGPASDSPLSWVTFLEYRDWTNGEPGTLLVATQLSLANIYTRLSAAQGLVGDRSFGQALLLALFVVGGLFLIIGVVALVVSSALARSITGSVHELFAGTERVRHGDFTHKIAITAQDQLGELAESFNSMTASIEDLLRQAAEKKRLEEELRIAHEIQMSLLPQGPLMMPGLSVTALCIPAREVGGDYYDFLPLDDHRVGLLIADVAGKGTSAALYMAELKGLILSLSRIHASPRALLISANRLIAEHLGARSFITMTYAIIDLRARTMTYARAGHTPLMHVPGPGCAARRAASLTANGMVVGLRIDGGETFERLLAEETVPLGMGDLFLLYTDGISEAMNGADECFGEGRLGQILEDHADLPPDELRERVLREVEAFVGSAPQHDDMTMLLLKVTELPAGAVAVDAAVAVIA